MNFTSKQLRYIQFAIHNETSKHGESLLSSEEQKSMLERIQWEIEWVTKEEEKRARLDAQKKKDSEKKSAHAHICPSCGVAHNKIFSGSTSLIDFGIGVYHRGNTESDERLSNIHEGVIDGLCVEECLPKFIEYVKRDDITLDEYFKLPKKFQNGLTPANIVEYKDLPVFSKEETAFKNKPLHKFILLIYKDFVVVSDKLHGYLNRGATKSAWATTVNIKTGEVLNEKKTKKEIDQFYKDGEKW